MWKAQVFTLYPEMFPGPLVKGLYGKALANKLWDLNVINIRDSANDKHKTVDDTPYGGGTGMLLKADVLANSLDQNIRKGERIFYLTPKGKKFDQGFAQDLLKEKSISLVCGHFEGVDERILATRNIEEISVGDYVLSGGEIAAFVVLDSVLRLLPGVLGNNKSSMDLYYSYRARLNIDADIGGGWFFNTKLGTNDVAGMVKMGVDETYNKDFDGFKTDLLEYIQK